MASVSPMLVGPGGASGVRSTAESSGSMTVPAGPGGRGRVRAVAVVVVVSGVVSGVFSGVFSSGGIGDRVARVGLRGLLRGLLLGILRGGRIGVAGGRDGRLHVGRVHPDRLRRRVAGVFCIRVVRVGRDRRVRFGRVLRGVVGVGISGIGIVGVGIILAGPAWQSGRGGGLLLRADLGLPRRRIRRRGIGGRGGVAAAGRGAQHGDHHQGGEARPAHARPDDTRGTGVAQAAVEQHRHQITRPRGSVRRVGRASRTPRRPPRGARRAAAPAPARR